MLGRVPAPHPSDRDALALRDFALDLCDQTDALALRHLRGELRVHVSDNGRGYDTSRPLPACGPEGGFGLSSAEAQMLAIGGRLERRSSPGAGSHALLAWPCTLISPTARDPAPCPPA